MLQLIRTSFRGKQSIAFPVWTHIFVGVSKDKYNIPSEYGLLALSCVNVFHFVIFLIIWYCLGNMCLCWSNLVILTYIDHGWFFCYRCLWVFLFLVNAFCLLVVVFLSFVLAYVATDFLFQLLIRMSLQRFRFLRHYALWMIYLVSLPVWSLHFYLTEFALINFVP